MTSKKLQGLGGYGTYEITQGEGDYAWESLSRSDGVKFSPSDLPADIKNPSDIEVQSRSTWTTATVAIRGIESVDGSTVALFEQPYGAIAQSLGWGTAYSPSKENYVYNVFEFLDEPASSTLTERSRSSTTGRARARTWRRPRYTRPRSILFSG